MKKLLFSTVVLACFTLTVFLFQATGCKKTNEKPPAAVCDVRGFYTGANLSSKNESSPITYDLRDNNFAVGGVTANTPAVTFGGYRNTCDSVILSVYYTGGNAYYLLQGKLSSDKKTISGNFKNLTNTLDYGTFTMSK